MLVLSRQSEMFTNVTITKEKLQELAKANQDVTMRFRTYNIKINGKVAGKNDRASVDIAFDDDARNFKIERPERLLTQPV